MFGKYLVINVVFLDGGIKTSDGMMVAQAGDVVAVGVIKRLIKLYPILDENTKIMTIYR